MKLTLGLLILAVSVHATALVDTGPPDLLGNANDFVNVRLADAFDLTTGATIDTINFWYVTEQFGQQSDLTDVSWAIYSDSSGQLGTELDSGTGVPATSAYDTADYENTYYAQLSIAPVTLGSGIYWLELHGGSSLTDDNGGITVSWAASDDTDVYYALESPSNSPYSLPDTSIAVPGYENYAFQLDGSPDTSIPEPGSFWFAGLGAAALAGWARARGRRLIKAPFSGDPSRT